MKQAKQSMRAAILWIFLFTICVSGSASVALFYYHHFKKQHLQQPQYNIVAISQTTADKEPLKTIYLAELLQLSMDQPTNLFRFNSKEAQRILLNSPLIKSANIKKILPGTLYINYSLRKPFAYLSDYQNTVIDRERITFPFKPFFSPKRLPEIYLGLSDRNSFMWGKPLNDIKSKMAIYLVDWISENCCKDNSYLTRIDVSNILADSYGQRQIVAILEESIENEEKNGIKILVSYILRLSVDDYRSGFSNYLILKPVIHRHIKNKLNGVSETAIRMDPIIVDLRIPDLAYISGITELNL